MKLWHVSIASTVTIFVVVAATFWFRTIPLAVADEIGYLGIAQFMATGDGPNMASSSYYYFGYSVLLAPLYWISKDPVFIYHGAILINAACVALCVPLLTLLSGELGFTQNWKTVAIAILIALWPPNFFLAAFAWSEPLFRVLFLASILCVARASRTKRALPTILFAVCIIALYATHGRAIGIVPVGIITLLLLYFGAEEKTPAVLRWVGLSVILTIIGYVFVRHLHHYLNHALWERFDADKSVVFDRLQSAITYFGFRTLVIVAAGQAWYQIVSTFGLVLVGGFAATQFVWRNRHVAWALPVFYAIFAVIAVYAASVGQMLYPHRLDHVIYGRYIDAASIILVWMALISIALKKTLGASKTVLAGIIISTVLAAFVQHYAPQLEPLNTVSISGVSIFYGLLRSDFASNISAMLIGVTALSGIGAAILAFTLSRERFVPFSFALLALWAGASDYILSRTLIVPTESWKAEMKRAANIFGLLNSKPYWSESTFSSGYVYTAEFWEMTGKLPSINFKKAVLPRGSYAIVGDPAKHENLTCVGSLGSGLFVMTNKNTKPNDVPRIATGARVPVTSKTVGHYCLLGSGWSVPEAWGTWTDSKVARVYLDLKDQPKADLKLTFGATGFSRIDHQTVTIYAAGSKICSAVVTVDQTKVYSATIPKPLIKDRRITLEFHIKDPISPKELGRSGDARRLGLGLLWLRFDLANGA